MKRMEIPKSSIGGFKKLLPCSKCGARTPTTMAYASLAEGKLQAICTHCLRAEDKLPADHVYPPGWSESKQGFKIKTAQSP
jgi:hypothetical protein